MKKEISSVDLWFLTRELRDDVIGSRLDKAFQLDGRQIILRLFGKGSKELFYCPQFICLTKYKRSPPTIPKSFAMQLRKNLRAKEIIDVRQIGFDRILEIQIEGFILIFELFSKGNAILCDDSRKILGLLDWQKWKDRTLGVGQVYEYPPSVSNPMAVEKVELFEILSESKKSIASTFASKFSLGGYWAEWICKRADIPPMSTFEKEHFESLWTALVKFRERLSEKPNAILSEDNVLPFGELDATHESFNEAVDDFFSTKQITHAEEVVLDVLDTKVEKLKNILEKQQQAYEMALLKVDEERLKGDKLFQHLQLLQAAYDLIKKMRKQNRSDKDIIEGLAHYPFIKEIRGFEMVLDFDQY